MIVELFVGAVIGLVEGLVGLLPTVSLPFADTLSDFAELIGSQLGGLNSFLPISEAASVIGWALTVYLPFVLTFLLVRWVYSMLPVVGQ